MRRCPITYELIEENQKYSKKGLQLLSKSLHELNDFPYTPQEQIQKAAEYSDKLSIQGVQPKLSIKLNVKKSHFEITANGGQFILKPPHNIYKEIPQNEDLTMRLAKSLFFDVPLHGMIYNIDDTLSYFIKRFDRMRGGKIAVEDFSQLLGYTRDTKYESSMEQVVSVIDKHCSFPFIEKLKLFRLMLFNFIVGNEDMHLKNFSLIRRGDKIELSPVYDLLSTSLAMETREETALPIKGKKNKLTRSDFDSFGRERLKIPSEHIDKQYVGFQNVVPTWKALISISFLSQDSKEKYLQLISGRLNRLL